MSELWKHHGVQLSDEWSSLVFARVRENGSLLNDKKHRLPPIGYIFVIEPKRPDPRFKIPGGHKKPGHSPLVTAMAEFEGETGINAPVTQFTYVGSAWRRWPEPHWSCLFTVDLQEFDVPWMHAGHPDNEGEKPRYLTVDEFYALVREDKFLPYHYQRLVDAALILPLGRDRVKA